MFPRARRYSLSSTYSAKLRCQGTVQTPPGPLLNPQIRCIFGSMLAETKRFATETRLRTSGILPRVVVVSEKHDTRSGPWACCIGCADRGILPLDPEDDCHLAVIVGARCRSWRKRRFWHP